MLVSNHEVVARKLADVGVSKSLYISKRCAC
eukprot:SAG11_NODE_8504_length_1008_cov_1.705171_1_plen_30_part_10